MKRLLFLLLLSSLLCSGIGCSLLPEQADETKDWTASELYSAAKDAMKSKNYETAIRYFELLEARFPFGRYAQQAQLEVGYAYYKYDEPDSALAAMDRFIKMHPRHPNVDYAHYLKGLVNFDRGEHLIDRWLPRDPAQRDPGYAREAFVDFSALVDRYPNSKYADDARQRMIFLRNNLAQYEVHVADYYLRRGAYLAAANRAIGVIEQFQGTEAVQESLTILIAAYDRMQLTDLSADAQRVRAENYPAGAQSARAAEEAEEGHWWWPFSQRERTATDSVETQMPAVAPPDEPAVEEKAESGRWWWPFGN